MSLTLTEEAVPKMRLVFAAGLAMLTATCDPTDPVSQRPNSVTKTDSQPIAPSPLSLATLELNIEGSEFYQGSVTAIILRGYASNGRLVNVDSAQISSSDPSVVSLGDRSVLNWSDSRGNSAHVVRQVITMTGSGTVVLRASMSGVTGTLLQKVLPIPPVSSSIVIDSFTVVEYRDTCAWDCPYLAYAPLLKVREPTGQSPVYILAVQFDVSTRSTGLCHAEQLRLEPGFVGHINGIKSYLWSNDLVLVELDGTPLPPGDASVRVIFRDAQGKAGIADATAPIQRMVRDPVFPQSRFETTGWRCAFHSGD